ncbi:MAG: flagellar export protein FliJ [Bacillota bacterium]|nr:flagellar export protein FliJ [Bacillota bacterium]
MEQFKFPLQKLLDIRLDKEEQSRLRLMEAQSQKDTAETKLRDLKATYEKYNIPDKNTTTAEKKIKNTYMTTLDWGIKNAGNELVRKNAAVDNCRQDLKTRQVERKTVETVKDRRYETFIKEQERKEQIQNDEFALYSFMRKIEGR